MTAFGDSEVDAMAGILGQFLGSYAPSLIHDASCVLEEIAPAIAARAVSQLMDDLTARDEAGEFGECCANPYCRACTVLQHVAVVAAEAVGG